MTASDCGVGRRSEQKLTGKRKGTVVTNWDTNGVLQFARGTLHTEDSDERESAMNAVVLVPNVDG